MTVQTFLAGQTPTADEINVAVSYGTVVGRGRRETNSTAASAEQSVLRVDGISLKSGNLYWIASGPLRPVTTVANDVHSVILRIDVAGAAATTSSSQLQNQRVTSAATGTLDHVDIGAFYVAVADVTLSVLLSTARVSGTGTIALGAASTVPIDLFVIDCGVDPGDTGVDL